MGVNHHNWLEKASTNIVNNNTTDAADENTKYFAKNYISSKLSNSKLTTRSVRGRWMQTKVGLTYVTTAAPLNTFNTTTQTNAKDMKDNNGSEAILTLREHLQQLLSIFVFDNNKKIKIRKK